jgi:hypothetical protein
MRKAAASLNEDALSRKAASSLSLNGVARLLLRVSVVE